MWRVLAAPYHRRRKESQNIDVMAHKGRHHTEESNVCVSSSSLFLFCSSYISSKENFISRADWSQSFIAVGLADILLIPWWFPCLLPSWSCWCPPQEHLLRFVSVLLQDSPHSNRHRISPSRNYVRLPRRPAMQSLPCWVVSWMRRWRHERYSRWTRVVVFFAPEPDQNMTIRMTTSSIDTRTWS